ncbi:hypothetical protein EYF80_066290 [Liparis tanakae]|uniref:Uncharacterized protein n=1 Tax=Liparis tanakae TaxID=230148 RepID=A0A4Z2E4A8_9TELE|nr:hypothetical protein EYF80_066290 [Liparis tanakae]
MRESRYDDITIAHLLWEKTGASSLVLVTPMRTKAVPVQGVKATGGADHAPRGDGKVLSVNEVGKFRVQPRVTVTGLN